MNEYVLNVHLGTVELQQRLVPVKDGLKSQSRRIERDRENRITHISEWEDLGSVITFGANERKESWLSKWLLTLFKKVL